MNIKEEVVSFFENLYKGENPFCTKLDGIFVFSLSVVDQS